MDEPNIFFAKSQKIYAKNTKKKFILKTGDNVVGMVIRLCVN